MKRIIFLGSIVTIILVKLPVFELTKISANDRLDKFIDLQTLKYNVINEYLRNFIIEKAFQLLSQFVLHETEMYEFAKYLNETGMLPIWSKQQILKNPKLYELLRYDITVELIPLNMNDVIQRALNLKTKIFHNSPEVSIQRLCNVYVYNKLNEIISLPDYYALIVLSKDRHQLKLKNPVGWRIRRALYSLAIRQYNPDEIYIFSPITCFNEELVNANSINDFKAGVTIEFKDFFYCYNHNILQGTHLNSSIINKTNSTHYRISYKIVVTDPRSIVNLEEITRNDESYFNVILPNIEFFVVKDPVLHNTFYGLAAYVTIETKPILKSSKWLASIANTIEQYKQKEE